jgi:hypothetical protein
MSKGANVVLLVVPFRDGTDPVALGDLAPLGHGLARCTRVISAHVAALRASDELLRRGEVTEARVMYGLPQAQGIIRDLQAGGKHGPEEGRVIITTCVFRSPDFSGKEVAGPFTLLGTFGLGR